MPRGALAGAERSGRVMPSNLQVAIDGPVASGKTTVARALARRIGALYLDTGAMYRALAYRAQHADASVSDESALIALLREAPIDVRLDAAAPLGFRVMSGDVELGAELFQNDVSAVVSAVAAHPRVRAEMVQRQRAIAAQGAVVMAGRDIGTVVLPDATVKIFLTASVDARVERRLAELLGAGTSVDRNVLRVQIAERDQLDRSRAVAPLRPADDAVEIDSSAMSVENVVEQIAALVTARSPR
jgi:cytidylate kinase